MPKKDSEYISLKQAAELSGYSADYVGQLIREGKIHGKQVFSNVAWVTTERAIREYVDDKGKVSATGYGAFELLKKKYSTIEGLLGLARAAIITAMVVAGVLTFFAFCMFMLSLDNRLERNSMETTEYAP